MFSSDYNEQYYFGDPSSSYSVPLNQPRRSLDSGYGHDSFLSDLNDSQCSSIQNSSFSNDPSLNISVNNSSVLPSDNYSFVEPTNSKWAKVTTPPNHKLALKRQNQQDDGLFTPPSKTNIKFFQASPRLFKTPEYAKNIYKITTPSPFKITFSKSPLRLSNNENVTEFQIDKRGACYRKINGSNSKRCIVPEVNGFTLLASPSTDVPDSPKSDANSFKGFAELPCATPSKINAALKSGESLPLGLFNDHGHSPYASTSQQVYAADNENYTQNYSEKKNSSRNLINHVNETYSRFDVKSEIEDPYWHGEFSKEIVDQPQSSPYHSQENVIENMETVSQQEVEKETEVMVNATKDEKEVEREKWKNEPFITPNKDLPLYSGHWLVISTGQTLEQQQLTSQAYSYLKSRRKSSSSSSPRIPTIAKVTLFKHRYSLNRLCRKATGTRN